MTGFELRASGIGSNYSTNCATATAQKLISFGASFVDRILRRVPRYCVFAF